MKITVIISTLLVSQVTASFFDVFQSAVSTVQNSVGKLFNDVVTDVKDTVDCTILAVEHALALRADADRLYYDKCGNGTKNSSSQLQLDEKHTPIVERITSNEEYLKKEVPDEIDARINDTLTKFLNGYNSHEKLEEIKIELAKETQRLADVSEFVKMELDRSSNEIQFDASYVERNESKPSIDNILEQLKLLEAVEKNLPNSHEANEVHKIIDNILHKLNSIESTEAAQNDKVENILKELENNSNTSYKDIRQQLNDLKEDENRHLDLIQQKLDEHEKSRDHLSFDENSHQNIIDYSSVAAPTTLVPTWLTSESTSITLEPTTTISKPTFTTPDPIFTTPETISATPESTSTTQVSTWLISEPTSATPEPTSATPEPTSFKNIPIFTTPELTSATPDTPTITEPTIITSEIITIKPEPTSIVDVSEPKFTAPVLKSTTSMPTTTSPEFTSPTTELTPTTPEFTFTAPVATSTTQLVRSTTPVATSTTPVSTWPIPEPTSTTPEPMSTTPEPTSTTPEPTSTTPEPTSTSPEPTSTTPEPTSTSPEPTSTSPEPTSTTPEPTSTTPEPTSTTPEPTSTSPEPTSTTPEPTSTSPEPTSTTPDPTSTTPEPTSTTPEPTSTTPEPTSTTPEPTSTTPEPTSTTPEPTSTTSEPMSVIPDPSSSTTETTSSTLEPTSTTSEVIFTSAALTSTTSTNISEPRSLPQGDTINDKELIPVDATKINTSTPVGVPISVKSKTDQPNTTSEKFSSSTLLKSIDNVKTASFSIVLKGNDDISSTKDDTSSFLAIDKFPSMSVIEKLPSSDQPETTQRNLESSTLFGRSEDYTIVPLMSAVTTSSAAIPTTRLNAVMASLPLEEFRSVPKFVNQQTNIMPTNDVLQTTTPVMITTQAYKNTNRPVDETTNISDDTNIVPATIKNNNIENEENNYCITAEPSPSTTSSYNFDPTTSADYLMTTSTQCPIIKSTEATVTTEYLESEETTDTQETFEDDYENESSMEDSEMFDLESSAILESTEIDDYPDEWRTTSSEINIPSTFTPPDIMNSEPQPNFATVTLDPDSQALSTLLPPDNLRSALTTSMPKEAFAYTQNNTVKENFHEDTFSTVSPNVPDSPILIPPNEKYTETPPYGSSSLVIPPVNRNVELPPPPETKTFIDNPPTLSPPSLNSNVKLTDLTTPAPATIVKTKEFYNLDSDSILHSPAKIFEKHLKALKEAHQLIADSQQQLRVFESIRNSTGISLFG